MGVRLWCLGDLHLGRQPHRLTGLLEPHAVRAADLTPEVGLRRAVDAALARDADAVLFAGDLVESLEDRFRALAPLHAACERLAAAGVPVFAVAGNHDVHALPALARRLEAEQPGALTVLGADGDWGARVVEGGDGVRLRLVGRSFRQVIEPRSPLATLDAAELPDDGLPTIGLLHCDLDQAGSRYAPVARREFDRGAAGRCAAWLLGHVHRPDRLDGPRPVGYLGSVVALDAGEPGPHGPWLVEVDAVGAVRAEQVPLSPLRFERVVVDCAQLVAAAEPLAHLTSEAAEDRLVDLLHAALGAALDAVRVEQPDLDVLAVRAELRGAVATAAVRAAVARLAAQPERRPAVRRDRAVAVLEGLQDQLSPTLDRGRLAAERGPLGELARLVQALAAGGDEAASLVRDFAAGDFERQLQHGPWAGWLDAGEHEAADPDPAQLLHEVAADLLAELHGRRAAAQEDPS